MGVETQTVRVYRELCGLNWTDLVIRWYLIIFIPIPISQKINKLSDNHNLLSLSRLTDILVWTRSLIIFVHPVTLSSHVFPTTHHYVNGESLSRSEQNLKKHGSLNFSTMLQNPAEIFIIYDAPKFRKNENLRKNLKSFEKSFFWWILIFKNLLQCSESRWNFFLQVL